MADILHMFNRMPTLFQHMMMVFMVDNQFLFLSIRLDSGILYADLWKPQKPLEGYKIDIYKWQIIDMCQRWMCRDYNISYTNPSFGTIKPNANRKFDELPFMCFKQHSFQSSKICGYHSHLNDYILSN